MGILCNKWAQWQSNINVQLNINHNNHELEIFITPKKRY